ncbi:hypothetical protein ALC57_13884 [Trachymyrmex cornetzi]|uniref:Uncharacterized protein n=1 Tax=Trachymyrmex cornetzi TaxID=471704 RepID=A0A195DLP0_9HYME|nr:hypothetical protein ALC57_13884 [Trachymyrmex cornetzi]
MALYNDKDTPGRLGAFRSTKGAALGSSYRTGTCFVRRGQMSPIMFSGACGRKSQNNSRTENTVVKSSAARNCVWCPIASLSALLNVHRRRRSEKQKDRKKEKNCGEAVRWFRDESSRNIGHPKPLKNSDNTSPGSGAHLNMHPRRTNNFGERIGESAIRNNRSRKQDVEAATAATAAASSEKIGKAHYAKSQCLMKIANGAAHEAAAAAGCGIRVPRRAASPRVTSSRAES